jgi:REP element-mobilizing transposase RayT
MPRPPRLEVCGALYHVTARGNERRALFRDDADREEYLRRIARYREKFRFRLLSYCLMTNHVHLAIRAGEQPLSRVMAGLHSSYAEWFNRRHRRVGHLFQGRYKALLIQENRHLQALVRYIHRNPVKARIVARAAEYPWSSDRYLRRGEAPPWLDAHDLLALLGNTRRLAVRRYVELVEDPGDAPGYDPSRALDQAVVGDEVFAAAQWDAAPAVSRPRAREARLDDVLGAVARDGGFTTADLYSGRRGGELAATRCRAVYLARLICGVSARRVALHLGRDDSAFVRPLARLERSLETDPATRARMNRLLETLMPPPNPTLPPPPSSQHNQD